MLLSAKGLGKGLRALRSRSEKIGILGFLPSPWKGDAPACLTRAFMWYLLSYLDLALREVIALGPAFCQALRTLIFFWSSLLDRALDRLWPPGGELSDSAWEKPVLILKERHRGLLACWPLLGRLSAILLCAPQAMGMVLLLVGYLHALPEGEEKEAPRSVSSPALTSAQQPLPALQAADGLSLPQKEAPAAPLGEHQELPIWPTGDYLFSTLPQYKATLFFWIFFHALQLLGLYAMCTFSTEKIDLQEESLAGFRLHLVLLFLWQVIGKLCLTLLGPTPKLRVTQEAAYLREVAAFEFFFPFLLYPLGRRCARWFFSWADGLNAEQAGSESGFSMLRIYLLVFSTCFPELYGWMRQHAAQQPCLEEQEVHKPAQEGGTGEANA